MLVKDLPSNKELKIYFTNYFNANWKDIKVKSVKKYKQHISIECTFDEIGYIPAFFIRIFCINTRLKVISLLIDKEFYEHVAKNYEVNAEYYAKLN